jgi:gas vesicle protein
MSDNNSSQVGGFLTAFAIGALMGAGMALLYAPRSGKETRELLAQRTRELKNRASDALDQAKETVLGKKTAILAAVEAGKVAMREQQEK